MSRESVIITAKEKLILQHVKLPIVQCKVRNTAQGMLQLQILVHHQQNMYDISTFYKYMENSVGVVQIIIKLGGLELVNKKVIDKDMRDNEVSLLFKQATDIVKRNQLRAVGKDVRGFLGEDTIVTNQSLLKTILTNIGMMTEWQLTQAYGTSLAQLQVVLPYQGDIQLCTIQVLGVSDGHYNIRADKVDINQSINYTATELGKLLQKIVQVSVQPTNNR